MRLWGRRAVRKKDDSSTGTVRKAFSGLRVAWSAGEFVVVGTSQAMTCSWSDMFVDADAVVAVAVVVVVVIIVVVVVVVVVVGVVVLLMVIRVGMRMRLFGDDIKYGIKYKSKGGVSIFDLVKKKKVKMNSS